MTTLVNANNLALIRGHRQLFKSLNFSLEGGQAIHLQGKNGSGKTSLLKILAGIIEPTAGCLRLWGKSFKEFEPSDYENLLYIGHQTPIKHSLTVAENLKLNAELFDRQPVNKEQLEHALSAVGLWAFRDQCAGKLSAGQKRRILLARLWITPYQEKSYQKLWLLDEPTTALDSNFIDTLQVNIAEYLARGGSVIFSSHQSLKLGCKSTTIDLQDFQ